MRTWLPAIAITAILLAAAPLSGHATQITHYAVIFRPGYDLSGTLWIAVRQYEADGESQLLVINPQSLETAIVPATTMRVSAPVSITAVSDTAFMRALTRFTAPPYRLHNYGAIRAPHALGGVVLTVDMDPSRVSMDRQLFARLADLATQRGAPTPVAIAMTGRWLVRHEGDLTWLQEQVTQHRLAITWFNHSYHHPYHPGAPMPRNFLLTPGTNFLEEVTKTEIALLGHGIVPSPFFRFPGLVASAELIETLRTLSLIPIGSDAWLGKGQMPTDGSFILVHGNGNEAWGVARLLRLIDERPGMMFVPLQRAFTRE